MSNIWRRLRGQWFRILLVGLSVGLIVLALGVWFQAPSAAAKPAPLPVGANEYEIVWLYPAVNTAAWERFVTAVQRTGTRLAERQPNLEVEVGAAAFPRETTAVPEIALKWRDTGTRLVFRWYKLTSSWPTRDWVAALAQRRPPPLAVIGGSSSDTARELASQMEKEFSALPAEARPLLLLTTATADNVTVEGGDDGPTEPGEVKKVSLMELYPGRTFRYCFTNNQMATAVVQFILQNDALRPDSRPIHTVRWLDDSYSPDLIDGFLDALRRRALTRDVVRGWAATASCTATGPIPFALTSGFLPLHTEDLSAALEVDSSVGTFANPNRFEAQAAEYLLDEMKRHPSQHRPLLIVSGQSQPTRRFLLALARGAPDQARRFVVATGDTLSFNTVYRDRKALWPIQDLPFNLVFFCHRNPIDPDGFDPARRQVTGTEDLLLYGDLVETLALGLNKDGKVSRDAAVLAERLNQITLTEGSLGFEDVGLRLFTHHGNRRSGTGEHVVSLRPMIEGERVLPGAEIEVWARRRDEIGGPIWARVGDKLLVRYDEDPRRGDVAP
jgi:hypothetical protein